MKKLKNLYDELNWEIATGVRSSEFYFAESNIKYSSF